VHPLWLARFGQRVRPSRHRIAGAAALVRASATPTPPVQQLAALILESVRGGSASFERIEIFL
jgi:hypothetical protein